MTREQTQEIVAILAATWTRPPVEKATVHAYAFALADLDHVAAKAAVLELMQTSRFLPTIAEIRERCVKGRVNLPTPEEAFGIVRRAIGRHGAYLTPVFDCEEIQSAVDAISWKEICLGENPVSNRARFIDAYRGFVDRRMREEATGKYVPSSRQLPAWGQDDRPIGETRVLVETGYASPRVALPMLPSFTFEDESVKLTENELKQLVAKVLGEEAEA